MYINYFLACFIKYRQLSATANSRGMVCDISKTPNMIDINLISAIIATIGTVLGATSLTVFKTFFDKKKAENEEKEVTDNVEKIISKIIVEADEKKDDVLALMIKNVGELREYYIINKQQARNSFSAALFISFLGFTLFATGIILTYVFKTDNAIQYSTICGAIVEIIAGLFFWLYSKAIKQINLFHNSLLQTEKFLTAIQLVEKISQENRDKAYNYIIEKVIDNNYRDAKE